MTEPSRASSRRALAGGVAVAIALAGAGFIVGRNAGPGPDAPAPSPTPSMTPSPTPSPPAPVVTPSLDRAAVLTAVRAAADAFASGRSPPSEVTALDGRRFELRLPFGCRGPAPADSPLGWRYDEENGALRVSASPSPFDPAAWLGAGADGVDLIEGFWVERPWTSSEACPVIPSDAPDGAPPHERTLALAQIHGTGESRVGRREGDAFQAVEKVAPDALRLDQGLRLRLTGRVVSAPGGRGPVICRSPTPSGGRPVCLLSVALDEVAIENPVPASTLATWAVSSAGGEEGR